MWHVVQLSHDDTYLVLWQDASGNFWSHAIGHGDGKRCHDLEPKILLGAVT